MPRRPAAPDLRLLLDSWTLHLRAGHKSEQTVKSYAAGVEQYLDWCQANSRPSELTRAQVNAFCASLFDAGREATTVRARQLGIRRFSAWLAEEGELDSDPLLGLSAPRLETKVTEPLSADEIKALLKSCAGRGFLARRDEALLRLMLETGLRAGEAVAMQCEDVDLKRGTAVIRRGKGGKGRIVPFGPQTAQALDRYRRQRTQHLLADSDDFWLGDRGKAFSYDALHKALKRRAAQAGITRFHPHLLRHTAAHRWLAAGGSESGLMAVAGWERPDMLQRYTRARAADRAAEESRRLNLGDL